MTKNTKEKGNETKLDWALGKVTKVFFPATRIPSATPAKLLQMIIVHSAWNLGVTVNKISLKEEGKQNWGQISAIKLTPRRDQTSISFIGIFIHPPSCKSNQPWFSLVYKACIPKEK